MVDAKKAAVGVAVAGAAVAAVAYYLSQQVPSGKFRLTIKAQADSTPIVIPVPVDGNEVHTGGYIDLDPGTYTVTAPDSVVDTAGVNYSYHSYELV